MTSSSLATVLTSAGRQTVEAAWQDGRWAVHRDLVLTTRWTITLLRTGRRVPGTFARPEDAVAAVPEIAALRPNWDVPLTPADADHVRCTVSEIVARHCGQPDGDET